MNDPSPPADPAAGPAAAWGAVWAYASRRFADDPEWHRLLNAAAATSLAMIATPPTADESSPPPLEATAKLDDGVIASPAPRARPSVKELAAALTFAHPASLPAEAPSLAWTHAPTVAAPDLAELRRVADRFVARARAQVEAGMSRTLSETFVNVAESLRLLHAVAGKIDRADGGHAPELRLLAEATSAARAAIRRDSGSDARADEALQDEAFRWLKQEGQSQQVYIDRHMKVGDPADPDAYADLRQRIADARRLFDEGHLRQVGLNKIRYHVNKLRADPSSSAGEWRTIADVAATLVRDRRLPASDVALRELLLDVLPTLPDEFDAPAEFATVLRAIDAYHAARAADIAEDDAAPSANDGEDVARVRAALAGRTVVMIGGHPRPHQRDNLSDALGAPVEWAESREHESPFNFAADVARRDVAVVVLTIRWMSHAFREVTPICRERGIPVVSLTAGSNPARIARAIREQAGQRLGIDPG